MKSIKDLRESYNLITEKEEHDMNKLSQLVRAGLFDAKKLSALKRAMEKPVDKMTAQEKRMMMNLLDSLMAEVLNDKQVYRKIKQDVMKEAMSDWETKDYFSKNDPRFGRGFPKQSQMPSVLLLKRKGIRVFPDGQKIGLYYAQAIDKYVSIPFEGINLSGHALHEETEEEDPPKKTGRKLLKPAEAGKAKWNIGGPKEKDDKPDAIRSRMDSLSRKANQAMLKEYSGVEKYIRKAQKLDKLEKNPLRSPKAGPATERFKSKLDFKEPERAKFDIPKEEPKTNLPAERPKTDLKTGSSPSVKDVVKSYAAKTITRIAPKVLGPVGALVGMTEPAGSKQEREWELDKSKRDKPMKGNAPKVKIGDAGSGSRLGKPEPKIELSPKKTDTLPAVQTKTQTSVANKTETKPSTSTQYQTKTQQKSQTSEKSKNNEKQPSNSKSRAGAGMAAGLLGGLAIGAAGVKGKPLTPNPTKLSLNVSAPKREGDPSAVASRQSALERKALKAQASMNESLDLDGNLFELNTKAAKKVSALYESLNKKNKKKMIEMMKESDESLEKVISFAVRQ